MVKAIIALPVSSYASNCVSTQSLTEIFCSDLDPPSMDRQAGRWPILHPNLTELPVRSAVQQRHSADVGFANSSVSLRRAR
jgi:hypothetical protein